MLHVSVDLAKSVFQVVYKDNKTSRLYNRQLTRKHFRQFLIKHQEPLCIGMEACGSAHFWGRVCEKLGHQVRIIPAQTVKFVNSSNKDDRNDAFCIWQSMHLPDIKTVKIRDESNQLLMSLLRLRDLIIKQKTQLQNNLRGCLYELGIICNGGCSTLVDAAQHAAAQAHEENKQWPELIAKICNSAIGLIKGQAKQLQTIDKYISEYTQKNESCNKLMMIPYVGPITAAALYAVMYRPEIFKTARHFAAYAGFAPAHTGTGGKIVMAGIPKKGKPILKRVLFQACIALYSRNQRAKHLDEDTEDTWLKCLQGVNLSKKPYAL